MNELMLPVSGQLVDDELREQIAGGQPVVLVDGEGRPVAVLVDVESWEEVEALTGAA